MTNILVFTGAGISAESGIPTFRSSDGLWANHRVEDVATPEGFKKNPQLVWGFYRQRFNTANVALPNAGHYAITRLQEFCNANDIAISVVTQNIDGLQQAAGTKHVIELHGTIRKFKCNSCAYKSDENFWVHENVPSCPDCKTGYLRPQVVWFHEQLPVEEMSMAFEFSKIANRVLVIGTSAQVFPAADVVHNAYRYNKAKIYEFNLEKCLHGMRPNLYEFRSGSSAVSLPAFVEEVIAGK